ncbi:hypothetical protein DPX39_100039500 [Trypanosoma brucei equiperdum]|uniref:Uncharacterized protein n=1 Tax=Trypanosoma brucei equiperdum TaxID=630700 RepID=A0A3L6L2V0_9TRYP|nr:hypothetical protein DPX39_100039500 [Trypanosoma brucei equiperdum]
MRGFAKGIGAIFAADASNHVRGKSVNADESCFGVFQNMHINPFPVRAAIDIGTGGMITMVVARVDAAANAVRNFMYQTQLPLHLESVAAGLGDSSSFVLSETTRADIRNKMRVFHGALRRDNYDGLSERAAVMSWPLCEAADALALAEDLTREFKVDVRVLGKTFNVSMPFCGSVGLSTNASQESMEVDVRRGRRCSNACTTAVTGGSESGSVQSFLHHTNRRRKERQAKLDSQREVRTVTDGDRVPNVPAAQQMEQLAFLAHAAVSKCVAPQRLLILAEDCHRGICVLGADTAEPEEVTDDETVTNTKGINNNSKDAVTHQGVGSPTGLLVHALPVDLAMAHRLLVTTVQRRSQTTDEGANQRSPNPVLREEFRRLRCLLEEAMHHTLPQWVLDKSNTGGVICGSSFNGGVLNVAARIAQRSSVSLDHLETHAEMHYCGLTDVLMSVNYPNAATVIPCAALASALLRSLDAQRFEYLPEVHIPAALLLQPSLWTYTRRDQVREVLKQKPFYAAGSLRRTFQRPHARENPTAAPTASWQKNKEWNALSYDNSTKGT